MTTILRTRQDKERSIQLIADAIARFIYPGISPQAQAGVSQHIQWMQRQPADLHVTCRLETRPVTQTTRLIIDASFQAIQSLATQDKA